tara:strand:+ start:1379 stop:1822 length:444 start_codon:yes stop_codon:yes gene_type:complete
MDNSDLENGKVRAFIINCAVNGIKTDINEDDERNEFAKTLAETLSQDPKGKIFATGDIDGILIEDLHGNPICIIFVRKGIIEFKSLSYISDMETEHMEIFARSILGTIGLTAAWHGNKSSILKPAGGLVHGGPEFGTSWDDDGFGIT